MAIGGRAGLPVVLEGLRRPLFSAGPRGAPKDGERLTAIVTVADDGGRSGRPRSYGVFAPGDIRNFRLVVSSVRGRMLPATLASISLVAELADGSTARGESEIGGAGSPIHRLRLEPEDVSLAPRAAEALRAADLVVIGPGSLYTSLIPPLLVRGLAETVVQSGAHVVLVMNAMTERGETDGCTASEHVAAIRHHAPELPIHDVLLNTSPVPFEALARYAAEGSAPVRCDTAAIEALGCRPLKRGLLREAAKVSHDPRALAAALLELVAGAVP